MHIVCNCKGTMQAEKERGQGRITWRVDSVLFSILRTVNRAVLRSKTEHQHVKLGVSEHPDLIGIKCKHPAVRVLVRKEGNSGRGC